MSIFEYLDNQVIDWDCYETSARQTRAILQYICEKKEHIKVLLNSFESNEKLHSMCETHQLLDYIVLYDNSNNHIRIRLHMSTEDHLQRPHDHRFDFSSLILNGRYEHVWYYPRSDIYASSEEDFSKNHQDKDHPDPNFFDEKIVFEPMFFRNESKGSCYSISHKIVHTVQMEKDTVTLIIRSPARTKRSFIYDINTESLWWRFSNVDEPKERRIKKVMDQEKREDFIKNLKTLGIF